MANTYLPRKDADLLAWSQNFGAQIATTPEAYGLTLAQEGEFASEQAAYASAYAAANNATTRTTATIQVKNSAKAALIAKIRELVDICQAWPEMTDDKRALLQITIRDNTPTPVPVPETSPVINVLSVSGYNITIKLQDADSSRRARPEYVVGATVFTYVGEAPPADLSDWKFEGNVRKTVVELEMPSSVGPGSKVWITAFWRNNRDESGPATTPIFTWTNNGGVYLNQAA